MALRLSDHIVNLLENYSFFTELKQSQAHASN